MKNKKWIGICMVCAAFAFALASGSLALGAEEDMTAAETEQAAEASAGADTETDAAVNEYGLTDAQMEALLESVKTSVTEEYLNAYDVSPEELQLELGTLEDADNPDFDGFNWSHLWERIDYALLEEDFKMRISMAAAIGADELTDIFSMDELTESLAAYTLEATLEEQNHKVIDNSGGGVFYDPATQEYPLANAIYIGIANYFNGLDYQELTEIFCNMYKSKQEIQKSGASDNDDGFWGLTLDRAIVDNLRFS